ncbi:MAG: hypothetical protein Q8O14_10945 [bacterium]|nr:hypothetical protein [bacterium]
MKTLTRWLTRFLALDRRWIFLLMALCILTPLIVPFGLPFRPDPAVQRLYQAIEDLDEGSLVLISCDYDPGSKPELQPFTEALFHHLFRRKLKVVVSCLWPGAPPLVNQAIAQALAVEEIRALGLQDKIDYVNLGYKDGRQLAMLGMGENIHATFPKSYDGTPIAQIPIMQRMRKLGDSDLFVNVSGGSPGTKEWVETAQGRFGLRMVASCTAVMAPDNIPYYEAGQLVGLAGGMKGSADYELLVGVPGTATRGMDAQSFGHLLIIAFIALGNVAYFTTRGRKH